jgi:hypothetical protein
MNIPLSQAAGRHGATEKTIAVGLAGLNQGFTPLPRKETSIKKLAHVTVSILTQNNWHFR